MRKWIWTALLILPLLVAGGLAYAHADPSETPAAASETVHCPLQRLHKTLIDIGAPHGAGKKPFCPLQWLMEYLHS